MTALLSYTHLMATITIRNLDDKVKRALQVRAALNGRSMEAEAREALSQLLKEGQVAPQLPPGTANQMRFAKFGRADQPIPPRQSLDRSKSDETDQGLGTAIHNLFAPLGGVELQISPRRKSTRPIPTFDE